MANKKKAKSSETPGIYIQSLTVSNARCFGPEPQTLRLSRPDDTLAMWTLILGENGTGKTTLLQMLACVRPTITDNPENHSTIATSSFYKRLFCSGTFRRSKHSPWATSLTVEFQIASVIPSENRLSDQRNFRFSMTDGSTYEKLGYVVGQIPYIVAYSTSRILDTSRNLIGLEFLEDPTENLFAPSCGLIDAAEWLSRLDYASKVPSPVQKQQTKKLSQVVDVLKRLLPNVEDIRFSQPESIDDVPTPEFQTPYGWVPLQSLSNGYQSMIAWVVDFAARLFHRYPDSPDPLAEPAICLIDEIDLHLHPHWQREIMGFLSERFSRTQFIATAHSPLIVQSAATVNANVAVLRRQGDHVVIDNAPDAVRGWRVDQILASDLFFGVSPWPVETQEKLDERYALLAKPKLSKEDKTRLQDLESHLAREAPAGKSPEENQLLSLLQRSLDVLEKRKSTVE